MLDQAHDLRRLAKPGGTAEGAVADVGDSPDRAVRRVFRTTDTVLLTTTADSAAVMGTFAAIKALAGLARRSGEGAADLPAFNFYVADDDPPTADAIQRRLARACRRLLGIELAFVGSGGALQPAAVGRMMTHRAGRS